MREFGDELSTVSKLTGSYGRGWQVRLEKADKNIWFCDGWKDFVEYHSICYGYLLVFHVLVLNSVLL